VQGRKNQILPSPNLKKLVLNWTMWLGEGLGGEGKGENAINYLAMRILGRE
jgi:hypothetical protein